MRCIVEYDDRPHPPRLRLYIHGAPHRRMHRAVLERYRSDLRSAFVTAGIGLPINHPIDLEITFISPTSPDLGNSYLALEQALDGSALEDGSGILEDDGLVHRVVMCKLFYAEKKKRLFS